MEVQTIYLCTTINNNSFYLLMRNIIFLYIYSKYIQNVHGFFAPTVLLTLHTRQWVYSRVEWFLKKKIGHMSCCSRLLWDPKSKILLWSVAFSPGAGPHAQGLGKSLKSLKKGLKSAHKTFLTTFLKVLPESKFVPYFI